MISIWHSVKVVWLRVNRGKLFQYRTILKLIFSAVSKELSASYLSVHKSFYLGLKPDTLIVFIFLCQIWSDE